MGGVGRMAVSGGLLVDGSGAPPRPADLLLAEGRVEAIEAPGALASLAGATRLSAGGLVLSPAFVDAHAHDDLALLEPEGGRPKLEQGFGTCVVGNCGISLAPWTPFPGRGLPPPPLNLLGGAAAFRFPSFAGYAEALAAAFDRGLSVVGAAPRAAAAAGSAEAAGRPFGPRPRAAFLCGHSALRARRVADLTAPARPEELALMLRDLEEALEAGARGLSLGLAYPAAIGSGAEELLALSRLVAARGRVLAVHIRNEYEGMWAALDEILAIACSAFAGAAPGAGLVLSHQKCAGPANRGRSAELLARLETAARELPLAFDAYPYAAGSTLLEAESVRASRRVLLTWSEPHPELAGLELDEALARLGRGGLDEGLEASLAELMPAGAAYFHMDEGDVDAILSHPLCMLGSDGLPADARPHPRLRGALPRYLARMTRGKALLAIEEAVRKATSLPARAFGLAGGGLLRPGAPADLVLWDPATIEAGADWEDPTRPPRGIEALILGGRLVAGDSERGDGAAGAVKDRPAAPRAR